MSSEQPPSFDWAQPESFNPTPSNKQEQNTSEASKLAINIKMSDEQPQVEGVPLTQPEAFLPPSTGAPAAEATANPVNEDGTQVGSDGRPIGHKKPRKPRSPKKKSHDGKKVEGEAENLEAEKTATEGEASGVGEGKEGKKKAKKDKKPKHKKAGAGQSSEQQPEGETSEQPQETAAEGETKGEGKKKKEKKGKGQKEGKKAGRKAGKEGKQQGQQGPRKPPFSEITGGCVCGEIKFTIKYPEDSTWPPGKNGTCQCTTCRKFTGSLVQQTLCTPIANIEPAFSSFSTFSTYKSSEKAERGFCSTCGSSLTFQYLAKPEEFEIHIGAIDEDFLAGRKHPEKKFPPTEYGTMAVRAQNKMGKGIGHALADADRHIWFCNAIPGVTGRMEGPKYWTDPDAGKPFDGYLNQMRKAMRGPHDKKGGKEEEGSGTGEDFVDVEKPTEAEVATEKVENEKAAVVESEKPSEIEKPVELAEKQ